MGVHQSLNRTILELKRHLTAFLLTKSKTLNRTILELKQDSGSAGVQPDSALNRTILELKHFYIDEQYAQSFVS